MNNDSAATVGLIDRCSATFLVLKLVSGSVPEPGAYAGDVEVDGIQAGCRITVLGAGRGRGRGRGRELWCQPRRPLPRLRAGNEATLRFGVTGGRARR